MRSSVSGGSLLVILSYSFVVASISLSNSVLYRLFLIDSYPCEKFRSTRSGVICNCDVNGVGLPFIVSCNFIKFDIELDSLFKAGVIFGVAESISLCVFDLLEYDDLAKDGVRMYRLLDFRVDGVDEMGINADNVGAEKSCFKSLIDHEQSF